jgi:hypothetical protein
MLGWVTYFLDRKRLAETRSPTSLRPLSSILFAREFTIPDARRERSAPHSSSKVVSIFAGGPGLGKTRLANARVSEANCELVIRLPSNLLRGAFEGELSDRSLWQAILQAVRHDISPLTIAYCLKVRRVAVLIEDLHLIAPSTPHVLDPLRSYFERHHSWRPKRLHLFVTTRDTVSHWEDASYESVEEFSGSEARDFFVDLCRENKFNSPFLQVLPDGLFIGDARTPLFVVICAYLAVRDEGMGQATEASIRELLGLRAHGVFARFMDELCARAQLQTERHAQILDAYRDLVLWLWPECSGFAANDIQARLMTLGTDVVVDELLTVGLLTKTDDEGLALPHPALGDHVAAQQMILQQRFHVLGNRPGAAKSMSSVLAFAPRIEHNVAFLAGAHVPTFVGAVARRPDLVTAENADALAAAVASATQSQSPIIDLTVWEQVRDLIARQHPGWTTAFCRALAAPSGNAIRSLAVFADAHCHARLDSWLEERNEQAAAAFIENMSSEVVRQYLLSRLSKPRVCAFVLIMLSRITTGFEDDIDRAVRASTAVDRSVVAQWIRSAAGAAQPDGTFSTSMMPFIMIERWLSNANLRAKLRTELLAGVVAATNLVLVARGKYPADPKRNVRIKRPFLVPIIAEQLERHSERRFDRALRENRISNERLMTFAQACAAHAVSLVALPALVGSLFNTNGGELELLRDHHAAFLDGTYPVPRDDDKWPAQARARQLYWIPVPAPS